MTLSLKWLEDILKKLWNLPENLLQIMIWINMNSSEENMTLVLLLEPQEEMESNSTGHNKINQTFSANNKIMTTEMISTHDQFIESA